MEQKPNKLLFRLFTLAHIVIVSERPQIFLYYY